MAQEPVKLDGRFPVAWLRDQPDKEAVKAELMAARPALERLNVLLQEKRIKASRGHQPDFLDAGWPAKAADVNGYFRALDEIEKLIPKY